MKKLLAILVLTSVIQGSLLLAAEQNVNGFKHLHKLDQALELRANCLKADENAKNDDVLQACAFLDNEFNFIIKLHKERRKGDPDMDAYFNNTHQHYLGGRHDPSRQSVKQAIKIIVPDANQRTLEYPGVTKGTLEYWGLWKLADQMDKEEYLKDLDNNK